MFIIPKFLNLYSKLGPKWQELRKRRRNLLLFAGPRFLNQPQDVELLTGLYGPNILAPAGANIQQSVSAFPYGTTAAAGAAAGGSTLALTTLNSSNFDAAPVESGVRFLRAGDVQELSSGVWSTQNTNTEWIAAAEETSTIGDDHQCRIDESFSSIIIFSSGWSENTYATINTTRTASIITFGGGETVASGTAYVRETSNTSNEVSASVFMSAEAFGGGIFC